MKILHVIDSLGRGGAERLLVMLLPELARQGHEVDLAVLRGPYDLQPELEAFGVRVSQLPKRHQWNLLARARDIARVMPDADIDQAVDALMGAGYGAAGERCMAVSVAVPVGEETADRLVKALAPKVAALKIGPSTDTDADMGPVITEAHKNKVLGYIDAGVKEGAELVVDGRGFKLQGYENGYFVGGSLFDRVTPDMSIYTDEIFGPVLSVVRADSYDMAVDLINKHEYGNGTAIFARDGDAARNFVDRIQVGMVGVNVPIPVPVGYHSFGGWKRSIFGSHGIYGPEAVHFYTKLKTVTMRWPTGIRSGAEFNFPSNG